MEPHTGLSIGRNEQQKQQRKWLSCETIGNAELKKKHMKFDEKLLHNFRFAHIRDEPQSL